jgi:hypothetical protein
LDRLREESLVAADRPAEGVQARHRRRENLSVTKVEVQVPKVV